MNARIDAERVLDAFLAPEADRLPDHVIDAALADIARTPQRRAPRVPWRFPHMPALSRTTSVAAVALVAVVGAGSLIYLNATGPSGTGGSTIVPTAAPSASQTTAPTPKPSGSGIAGWTPYTSAVNDFTLGLPPDWSVLTRATRDWREGDVFPADDMPYVDVFSSPGSDDETIGLFVWDMPGGDAEDLDTVNGLKAFAQRFCTVAGQSSCQDFTQRAEPMCQNVGGDTCRAALLVPVEGQQFAFLVDFYDAMFDEGDPVDVRVVVVARENGFPSAARYGGSVELLRSILTTMDVWTPGQDQAPQDWFRER
jgi:hypothetical protein